MNGRCVPSCFPFIRSGQNHLARHSERGKKTRPTKEEVGRQHQGIDRPGVRQVPEGSGEQGKMEKTGCKIICGAQTTLAFKGLMMMMMRNTQSHTQTSHPHQSQFIFDVLPLAAEAMDFTVLKSASLCNTEITTNCTKSGLEKTLFI